MSLWRLRLRRLPGCCWRPLVQKRALFVMTAAAVVAVFSANHVLTLGSAGGLWPSLASTATYTALALEDVAHSIVPYAVIAALGRGGGKPLSQPMLIKPAEPNWTKAGPDLMAFDWTDQAHPLPSDVVLDNGLKPGSIITVEGYIQGSLVMALFNGRGSFVFYVSYRRRRSEVVYMEGVSRQASDVQYPEELAMNEMVQLELRVLSGYYEVLINGTLSAVVPWGSGRRPEQVGTFSIRPYERRPHVLRLVRIAASNLPERRKVPTLSTRSQPAEPEPRNSSTAQPEVVVGVMTAISNYAARQAVRNSWYKDERVRQGRVLVRFFVGRSHDPDAMTAVFVEMATHQDLILVDALDSYFLVAYKTFGMLEWLLQVSSARYLIKCDDDTFLRLDRILAHLSARHEGAVGLYMGRISPASATQRDPTDRYFLARAVYPSDRTPAFAHGPAYIVSRNIAEYVVPRVRNGQLHLAPLEDIAMATWIDHAHVHGGLDVRYETHDGFRTHGCDENAFNAHRISPTRMVCMWQSLQRGSSPWCC